MYSIVDEIREIFEENDIGNEAVITDAEIIRIITGVDAEIDAALFTEDTQRLLPTSRS